jgi:hypothetical protein
MHCVYCGSENVEFDETIPQTDSLLKMGRITHIQIMCCDCQAEYTTNRQGTLISQYNRSMGVIGVFIKEDITPAEMQKICYEMRLINEGDEGGEE